MIVSDRWQVMTNVWNFMVWHPWLRQSLSKICSPLLSNRRCGLKRRNRSIPPRHARHVDQALMERLAEVEQHMEQLGEEQELMYELRAVIVHRGVVLTSGDGIENRNCIATNQRLQWWPPWKHSVIKFNDFSIFTMVSPVSPRVLFWRSLFWVRKWRVIQVDHGHYFAYVRSPSGSDLVIDFSIFFTEWLDEQIWNLTNLKKLISKQRS